MPDPWDPIDITYLRASEDPVLERASFAVAITPVGSYTQLAINGSYGR